MNINYLMQYISRQLHTNVRRFSHDTSLIDNVCLRRDFYDRLLQDTKLYYYFSMMEDSEFPKIFTDHHAISYAFVQTPDYLFAIGPVRMAGNTRCRYHLSDDNFPKEQLDTLYQCTVDELLKESLLLHNLFTEETLNAADIILLNCLDESIENEIQKEFSDLLFHNREHISRHNPYDQEVREISSIRNGDTEQLKKSWAEDYAGELGILASDPMRNYKNLGIVLVTLASRAAMEGGVMPELSYSLSDSYIRKIEEVQSMEAAVSLARKAEYQYALLVQDSRQKNQPVKTEKISDSRVDKCKSYIFLHLHEKIVIPDIARSLYINANYLSEIFKKQEGVTIGEYILKEKVNLAQNMLIYSRYSFIEIASYLGFSSQSYLGRQFKKVTGMTLYQYREKYGVKNFTNT